MFFANHPARKGLDSPHEIRAWRDRRPGIALGMEGAPGHQAAGIKKPIGPGSGRGFYDNSPTADSFPGYPAESYRTWGGFDWMTVDRRRALGQPALRGPSVVDHRELRLAHGLPRRLHPAAGPGRRGRTSTPTAGTATRCTAATVPTRPTATSGPATTAAPTSAPSDVSYAAVMRGLRAGRVWVDHGCLVDAVDVRVRKAGSRDPGFPLGSAVSHPARPAVRAGHQDPDRRARRTGLSSCPRWPRST